MLEEKMWTAVRRIPHMVAVLGSFDCHLRTVHLSSRIMCLVVLATHTAGSLWQI